MSSTILSLTTVHQYCQIQKKNGRVRKEPSMCNNLIFTIPTTKKVPTRLIKIKNKKYISQRNSSNPGTRHQYNKTCASRQKFKSYLESYLSSQNDNPIRRRYLLIPILKK